MPTFTNAQMGETITTPLTLDELAASFALVAPADSWLWFWIAKVTGQGQSNRAIQTPGVRDCAEFLADSFLYAIGMGLKRPMIRLFHRVDTIREEAPPLDMRYKIYLSKRGTICVKAGTVRAGTSNSPDGREKYLGCFATRNGSGFLEPRDRKLTQVERTFLEGFMADPVGFMAQTGRDMHRCCYCALALEDDRSRAVGYGPICAANWGLPWGHTGTSHKVRSFAELWMDSDADTKRNVRGLCSAIQAEPQSEELWAILGDILEDAGHQCKPKRPAEGTVIPLV